AYACCLALRGWHEGNGAAAVHARTELLRAGRRSSRPPVSSAPLRLLARFPLDVAADARNLLGDCPPRERRVGRGAQIRSGHRQLVARPAGIELAAIDQ